MKCGKAEPTYRQRHAGTVASRNRQAHLQEAQLRDQISAQVAAAFHQVVGRARQIDLALARQTAASAALDANLAAFDRQGVKAIEAQQAIAAVSSSRREYVQAVIGYNEAQFRLLWALGRPPAIGGEQPCP